MISLAYSSGQGGSPESYGRERELFVTLHRKMLQVTVAGKIIPLRITVVLRKSAYGRNTLQVCQRGGVGVLS